MDSSVDEEEVITSSSTPTSDSHRERDGPNESIITSLKSLDRISSNITTLVGSPTTTITGGLSSSSSIISSSSCSSTLISTPTSSSSSSSSSSISSLSSTTIASVQGTGSIGSNANSLPVRAANGIVFTSVPSPTSTGIKHNHNPVSQTIAVPQPGGAVSIVQLQLPNQTNVVQSVIQPVNQQSVIQATGGAASAAAAAAAAAAASSSSSTAASVQTVSIPKNIIFLNKGGQGSVIQSTEANEMNSIQPLHLISSSRGDHGETMIPSQQPPPQTPSPILDEEAKARREGLTRRPSYRKIFNDLSATNVGSSSSIADIKSEDDGESSESSNAATIAVASPYLKVVPTSTIQLASASQDGTIQGLQTLTMTNAASGGIVQYATQGQDGQFFVPVTVSTADLQAYHLRTGAGGPTGLPQGVVMTTPTTITSPHGQNPDETTKKRELRLLKNREAAKECRRKKKEYIKCLEQRVTVLETQNKALIEELKSLKELYCQKE
ncbi:cyclic AMP-responsive element-binding protein 1-like [Panonychus citri]|uniref:cyclic AMP-responsive element-binding protein 1-like n=1 Tax=Panonychus citri TaxID=50023 RepID=UPI002307F581|nr:cyclic AMP-responsive element-binding protein 1-like [Panonychus citri]XP_053204119.1 cyclic AMP-responsive element-binding protein 1-like [Panonychus citri]